MDYHVFVPISIFLPSHLYSNIEASKHYFLLAHAPLRRQRTRDIHQTRARQFREWQSNTRIYFTQVAVTKPGQPGLVIATLSYVLQRTMMSPQVILDQRVWQALQYTSQPDILQRNQADRVEQRDNQIARSIQLRDYTSESKSSLYHLVQIINQKI